MPVRGDNSLFFSTGIDNSGLQSGALDAQNIITGLGRSIASINPFAALAVGAATAFLTVTNEAYQFARQYEQAMKEVQTISKAAQDDFGAVSKSVFDLSKVSPEDPIKLAQAYYQIVSAGYDGAEALELLEVSSKAAIAGVTNTETAADGITTIMNAFRLSVEEAETVADAMFKTVELGKTTFGELSANLSTAAPLAAASGVAFQDVLSAVASLTKQGVPTAQAMTQIRAALEAVNEQLGSGWSNAYTLQEAFQLLFEEADGDLKVLKELTGRTEAVSAILGVSGDNAEAAAQDMEKLKNATGAAADAFGRVSTGNLAQFDLLKNRIKAATYELGQFALKASNDVVTSLNFMVKSFDDVSLAMERERVTLGALQLELNESNTSEERRAEIIDILQSKYPAYLSNLSIEENSMSELNAAIDKVNEGLINKIVLQKRQEEIDEEAERAALTKDEIIRKEADLREKILGLSERYNLTLKDSGNLLSDARDLSEQLIENGSFLSESRPLGVSVGVDIDEIVQAKIELRETTTLVNELTKEKKQIAISLNLDNAESSVESVLDKEIAEQLASIQEAKKRAELAPYLESENEKIRAAAEKRLEYLKSLYAPGGDDDGGATFKDFLSAQLKEYQAYEAVREQIGKEEANKQFADLLKQGENYGEFLRDQLSKTQDFSKQREIALSAENVGVNLQRAIEQKVDVQTQPINFEVKVDTESLNALENQLDFLKDEFAKAQTTSAKKQAAARVNEKQKEVDQVRELIQGEKELYFDLYEDITTLNFKELNERLKQKRTLLAQLLSEEVQNAQDIADARAEILATENEIGNKIDDLAGKFAGIFNSLSDLFSKFGNDEMGELLGQLAGVAQGAGTLAAGIASGDVFSIIQGSLDILNSAISVEIVSDTAKFEAQIDKLEKAVTKLDYAISQSIGDERIANRADAIKQLEELENQAQLAQEAEARARKETKLLGITIGNKGEGSGTNPEKIEELADQAEEARQKVIELGNEIDEIFTGTTSQSIADAIIDGLSEGKRGAEDFASNFEELMKDAVLESLKLQFLEEITNDFFKNFADAVESGGGLTQAEIDALRNQYNAIVERSSESAEALDAILESAGIQGGISGSNTEAQGLQNDIKTITEDTANVLAGTVNSMLIDIRNGLTVSRDSNNYLSLININTLRMVEQLEVTNTRLLRIENSLS